MPFCKICFNEIPKNSINSFRKDLCICQKCFKEFNPKFREFKIQDIPVLAIYDYDEIIRNKLYTLKGCYDYELAPVFLNRFVPELRLRYKGYVIVPFPSSKEDDEKRGFNHVEEIFRPLGLEIEKCIHKKMKFKQSDLSKEERKKISEKIELVDGQKLLGKKVLLVDDVLTTGSSMKAAISLIKQTHPKKIRVLLLARKLENKKENKLEKIKGFFYHLIQKKK